MISSQHHSFDIKLCAKYGMHEAVLIHHFQHWIRINRFKKRNLIDGKCWTYQTRKDIQAHFPYWTYEQVKHLCEKLIEIGVLIVGNYNKSPMDRTLWYAFVDEKAFGVDEESSNNFYEKGNLPNGWGNLPNAKGKSPSPIPDTITDTIPKNNKESGGKPPEPPTSNLIFLYKRVKMPVEKYDKLMKEFGDALIGVMLDRLDEYADINPKRFKGYGCHAAVIRKWIRDDKEKIKKPDEKAKSKYFASDVGYKDNWKPTFANKINQKDEEKK